MVYRKMLKYGTNKRYWKSVNRGMTRYGMRPDQQAAKALRIAMGLKSLINVEKKILDVGSAAFSASYDSYTMQSLSDIGQGNGINQRSGNSVKLLKMTGRFHCYGNASGAASQVVRIIIFRWASDYGDAPVLSDIIEPLGGAGGSDDILGPYNTDNGKFQIHFDKTITLSNTPNAGNNTKCFQCAFKLNSHVKYSGSSSTSEESGGLYMLALSNIANASSPPSVAYLLRTYYTDN